MEYICSVVGCDNQPVILAVVDDPETASVLVCGVHFKELEDRVISHVELPVWLTEGRAYMVGGGDVVFNIDLGPDRDGGWLSDGRR